MAWLEKALIWTTSDMTHNLLRYDKLKIVNIALKPKIIIFQGFFGGRFEIIFQQNKFDSNQK